MLHSLSLCPGWPHFIHIPCPLLSGPLQSQARCPGPKQRKHLLIVSFSRSLQLIHPILTLLCLSNVSALALGNVMYALTCSLLLGGEMFIFGSGTGSPRALSIASITSSFVVRESRSLISTVVFGLRSATDALSFNVLFRDSKKFGLATWPFSSSSKSAASFCWLNNNSFRESFWPDFGVGLFYWLS